MRIVVVGLGWLGTALAVDLAADGHDVHGTRTRLDGRDELARRGVTLHRLVARPALDGDAAILAGADRVVLAVPPSGLGDAYGAAIGRLAQAASDAGQLVHCSSTGVHPDRPGHPETDEDDVPADPGPRAARLLEAERAVREAGPPATVLRLAGLWGHGRHPVRFLAGRDRPGGDAPVNLVHRDDVIAAVRAVALEAPVTGTYAVVADRHPSRAEFYPAEARRLGLPPPRFGPGPSPGKRISGERLAAATGFRPRWSPGDPQAP
jgi:nucleoside-diphosphate-sugar epimerase